MMKEHLNDSSVYRLLSHPEVLNIIKTSQLEITRLVENFQSTYNFLDPADFEYLMYTEKYEYKIPQFYGLIKTHKPPRISNTLPKFKSRPVAGAHSWFTTLCSK